MQSVSCCALCDAQITRENDSGEHIILQSLGGRRQVFEFVCKSCNSKAGQRWDAKLNSEFSHVALMHGVDRQRSGTLPSRRVKTVEGTQLLLHADGTMSPAVPTVKANEAGGKISYSAVARTTAEAQKIIGGLNKKHPGFTATLTSRTEYNNEVLAVGISIGGPQSGRSLVKTAVALAHAMGIAHKDCPNAMHYLRNEEAGPCYGHFHTRDLASTRSTKHLMHCVSIKGNSGQKTLLGYVEYFGIAKVVVLLSDNYLGPDVQQTYAIDPSSGCDLAVEIDLALTEEELRRVVHVDEPDVIGYRHSLEQALPVLLERVKRRSQDQAIQSASEQAFKELGIEPGGAVEPSQYRQFAELVAKYFMAYVRTAYGFPPAGNEPNASQ